MEPLLDTNPPVVRESCRQRFAGSGTAYDRHRQRRRGIDHPRGSGHPLPPVGDAHLLPVAAPATSSVKRGRTASRPATGSASADRVAAPWRDRHARWLAGVGGLCVLAYVLPLFVPPGPVPSPRLGLEAGLWKRLFPHVPGWWMAGRLLALAGGAGLIAWAGRARGAWPRLPSVGPSDVPAPPGAARIEWIALAGAACLAAAGTRAAHLSRWAQAALVVSLAVPPVLLWLVDRREHASRPPRRFTVFEWTTVAVVLAWIALRIVAARHDARAADFVDAWKNFTILAQAAAATSGAVTQAAEVGVSNVYLLLVGLPFLGPERAPTFVWVQNLHACWIVVTAWAVACVVRRLVGAWAMAPAVATMLFSPFMLSMAVSMVPFGIATAFGAVMLLLVLRIRELARRADVAALGAVAGVWITFPHLAVWTVAAALAVLPCLVRRRPALVVWGTAALLALASIVPALITIADLSGMQDMYLQPRAVVAELEPIIMGQRYLPHREIGALWFQGVRGALDVPIATLLQPFAILRTPVRLSGDVYFEPFGAALAAVGIAVAVVGARRAGMARVFLLALFVAMLPGLLGSAFDRASLTRNLVLPVLLPVFTAVGLDAVRRLLRADAAVGLTVGTTLAMTLSGIVLFDVVNPRIVAGSWLGLTLQSLGGTPADRVLVLEHGNPRWEWLYAPEIMRHLPRAPIGTRAYRNAGILLARPDGDAPVADVLFWSPGLEEEESVRRTLCACWPRTDLYTIRDAAGLSRVFAARLQGAPWEPALPRTRWSVEACPSDATMPAACALVRARAHYNLAHALTESGRVEDAIGHHREALRRDPTFARSYNDLGVLLEERGDVDGAMSHYREALRLTPDDVLARLNLAGLLAGMGRLDEATEHYAAVLARRPNTPEALVGVAAVLVAQRRLPDAVEAYRAALRERPAWPPAAAGLAWVFATSEDASLRDPAEAMALATAAVEGSGGRDPMMLRTLAVAYAAAGRFDEAMATVERAVPLAREAKRDDLVRDLGERVVRYRAGRP